jgi:hypothetical protein
MARKATLFGEQGRFCHERDLGVTPEGATMCKSPEINVPVRENRKDKVLE